MGNLQVDVVQLEGLSLLSQEFLLVVCRERCVGILWGGIVDRSSEENTAAGAAEGAAFNERQCLSVGQPNDGLVARCAGRGGVRGGRRQCNMAGS